MNVASPGSKPQPPAAASAEPRECASASDDWPILHALPESEITIGRSASCGQVLTHASVSALHAALIHTAAIGLEVEDRDSRFGTFVNGVRVRRQKLKPGDLVRFGSAPSFRVDGFNLFPTPDGTGMEIALTSAFVERGGRCLLADLNVTLAPGSFVGVLGPSGAGKSLFLGCLATTVELSQGDLMFAGQRVADHPTEYLDKLGVVPQEDLVYDALTVLENLTTAATLRLSDTPPEQRERRVVQAMDEVDMAPHQAKLVSVLSGGQRKRVSVAIELLKRPKLLLLDEPTSGLDPGMQARIMDMLRRLARQGITVAVSTHTMDTLHYFDEVIVIAPQQGRTTCVFQGSPRDLLKAFHVRDTADLFDRLSEGTFTQPASSAAPAPSLTFSHAGPRRSSAGRESPDESAVPGGSDLRAPLNDPLRKVNLRQLGVIVGRSFTSLARDPLALCLSVAQPIVLAMLTVLSQARHIDSLFLHFFLIVAALWCGMTLTVREIVRERALYLRDRRSGLSPISYILGKMTFGAMAVAGQAVLLVVFARIMEFALVEDTQRWGDLHDLLVDTPFLFELAALYLAGLGGALLGLLMLTLARSEQVAVALLPLMLLPQILVSRVSTGAKIDWRSQESAFVPIAKIRGVSIGTQDKVIMVVSLPVLTRPATASLTLVARDTTIVATSVKLTEWLYFLVLLAIHAVAVMGVFLWCERRWKSAR